MADDQTQEMRDVVVARPFTLRRDDGGEARYDVGATRMPLADAEHWFTKHHLAPDGKAPPELLSGEPSANGVAAIIAARDTAQVDIATLKREVRRITDLWTETASKLRAREVELATLQAAQGNAQRPGEPAEANSQLVILQGRLAAAAKATDEKDAELSALRARAETAEARVQELERSLNDISLAQNGGAAQEPAPGSEAGPGPDAEHEDEEEGDDSGDNGDGAESTDDVKIVRQGKKFRVSRGGQLSEDVYPNRAAAQAAVDGGV